MGIESLLIKPGSPTKAVPGWDVRILDADGYLFIMGRAGDVINVSGHRCPPARWRRSSPPIRMSPSAPSSVSGMSSKARCRLASWCSRPAPTATTAS
jgi:hypothetical protein